MLKSELMGVIVDYFQAEGWKIEENIPKIEAVMSSGYGEGPIVIDLFGLVQTIHDAMQERSGIKMKDEAEKFLTDYWPRSMHPLAPEQFHIVRDLMAAFAHYQRIKRKWEGGWRGIDPLLTTPGFYQDRTSHDEECGCAVCCKKRGEAHGAIATGPKGITQ